jgi:predicted MFS family arabinose efflux permease
VPPLRASTLATTLSFVGTAGVLPLAVALVARGLGQPVSAGGALLSAFAFGALAGSLVLSARPLPDRWATRHPGLHHRGGF